MIERGCGVLDGQALRKAREGVGMSREQLAEKIHRSRVTVERWENSRHSPNSHTVMVLATVLGCEVEKLEVEE